MPVVVELSTGESLFASSDAVLNRPGTIMIANPEWGHVSCLREVDR